MNGKTPITGDSISSSESMYSLPSWDSETSWHTAKEYISEIDVILNKTDCSQQSNEVYFVILETAV